MRAKQLESRGLRETPVIDFYGVGSIRETQGIVKRSTPEGFKIRFKWPIAAFKS